MFKTIWVNFVLFKFMIQVLYWCYIFPISVLDFKMTNLFQINLGKLYQIWDMGGLLNSTTCLHFLETVFFFYSTQDIFILLKYVSSHFVLQTS